MVGGVLYISTSLCQVAAIYLGNDSPNIGFPLLDCCSVVSS